MGSLDLEAVAHGAVVTDQGDISVLAGIVIDLNHLFRKLGKLVRTDLDKVRHDGEHLCSGQAL